MAKKDNGNGKGKGKLTRRDFLKLTTAAGAAGSLLDLTMQTPATAFGANPFDGYDYSAKTVCPYCAVGCGFEIGVDLTADPNRTTAADIRPNRMHPINGPAACPKGQALVQAVNSPLRIGANIAGNPGTAPYTGPAIKWNGQWNSVSWSDILTADTITVYSSGGASGTVPGIGKLLADVPAAERPTKVAFLGSSQLNNEEAYLYRKLIALYGTPNIDMQAQI